MRLDKTWADYVAIAISPALIMLLVGSLMFFLLLAGYSGDYNDRLRWVMGCFVVAIVLISRISMEEGAEKAVVYGVFLTGAMALVVLRFVGQPIAAWIVLGIVWWSAHKLTWDCTLIDEQQDAAGEGLLQLTGLNAEADAASEPQPPISQVINPADTSPWRQFIANRRKRASAPGVWVVYYSLAALPLFGLGQWLIPAENLEARRAAFWYLTVYVGSALGLLLTTALLGLRRYLRQRKLHMPAGVTGLWIACGATLIVAVLAICAVIPRPSPEYAAGSFTGRLSSDPLDASQYAQLKDSGVEGSPGPGGERPDTSNTSQPPQGSGSQPAAGSQDSQGQNSQDQGAEAAAGTQGAPTASGKGGTPQQGTQAQTQGTGAPSEQGQATAPSNQASDSSSPAENTSQQKTAADTSAENSSTESSSQLSEPDSSDFMPRMPDFSQSMFLLGRWILNLILVVAIVFVGIRYGRQIVNGFQQLLESWRRLLRTLLGRQSEPGNETRRAENSAAKAVTFSDFPNPFTRPIPGVRTPTEVVSYSFRAVEAWAAQQGTPRRPQETPWEFADRLGANHAALARPVRELATLFARLNYGQQPPPAASLASVRTCWDALELLEAAGSASTNG